MSRLLFSLLSFTFILSNAVAQSVESEIYLEIEQGFEDKGQIFNELLDSYEKILVENKILLDTTAKSRRLFVHLVGQSQEFGRILPMHEEALELQLILSLKHLADAIITVQQRDSVAFSTSTLASVFNKIYANESNARTWQNNVRDALGQLKQEDWEHPFYRALTLFLSANFSDLRFISTDRIWESESDYKRLDPSLTIEKRNILNINENVKDKLFINGEIMDDVADLSFKVKQFYTTNRGLSKEETGTNIKDPNYDGWDLPFFSHLDLKSANEEIEETRDLMLAEIKKESPDWREFRMLCNMEEFWISSRRFLELTETQNLREIHPQAHIRIITPKRDTSDDITQELDIIANTVTQLRNKEALRVFGESYEAILNRQNFFLNDALKLRYLESQFPLLIMVNPQRSSHATPPPVDEIRTGPPPAEEKRTLPPRPKIPPPPAGGN